MADIELQDTEDNREVISVDQFRQLLESNQEVIENYIIEGEEDEEAIIKLENQSIVQGFKDIDFRTTVTIEGLTFINGVNIGNCTFSKPFTLHKSVFKKEFTLEDNLNKSEINITECSLESITFGAFKKGESDNEIALNIAKCKIAHSLIFNKSIIYFRINIIDTEIEGELRVSRSPRSSLKAVEHGDKLSESNIHKLALAGRSYIFNLHIERCIINQELAVQEIMLGKISIINSHIKDSILISSVKANEVTCNNNSEELESQNFYLNTCKIEKLSIGRNISKQIQLSLNSSINKLYLYADVKSKMLIDGQIAAFTTRNIRNIRIKINHLIVSSNIFSTGVLTIANLDLINLELININNDGQLKLFNISMNNEAVNKYLEQSKEYYSDKIGIIKMSNAQLGNISFYNVYFRSFRSIIIDNCNLNQLITIKRHIPTSIIEKYQDIYTTDFRDRFRVEELDQDPQLLAEVYNQLYVAMQKQGNKTMELEYYAEYQEWHRINLKLQGKEWSTRTALWLNKITTNYGLNWGKGVAWIVGTWLVFYGLFTLATWWHSGQPADFLAKNDVWSSLFKFFLPTHRIDNIITSYPTKPAVAYAIDVLYRLVVGFLIYQTIAAFRRFGKR